VTGTAKNGFTTNIRRVGFVSTRVSGTDGVSLEIRKWAEIFEGLGISCYYITGKSDRPTERTHILEHADFHHPAIREITEQSFGTTVRSRTLTTRIHGLTDVLREEIYEAIRHFELDLIVAQNSLTLPVNIPLGLALVEVLQETEIPCIAHHHDFVWERERFYRNAVDDYLRAAFPPPMPQIEHVAINSVAGQRMSRRTGLAYSIIPNVMDFGHPPPPLDDYARDFRETLGIAPTDKLILQPTRVVKRKGIEHTIELVRRLERPDTRLVITHEWNDEGPDYADWLREFADMLGVEILFASPWVCAERDTAEDGKKCYSIWDAYPHADLIAYPSTYEGFGNAFLEAVYHKKPLFCNRYAIYRTDIEPCGFEAMVMDGFLRQHVVDRVHRALSDSNFVQQMVERNYALGQRFFSFARAEEELINILRRIARRIDRRSPGHVH